MEDELQQSKESLTQSLDDNRILQNKLHTIQGLMDAVERKKSEQQKGLQQQVSIVIIIVVVVIVVDRLLILRQLKLK